MDTSTRARRQYYRRLSHQIKEASERRHGTQGAASGVRHVAPAGYKPPAPRPRDVRPPSAAELRHRKARALEEIADQWLLRRHPAR
jgi:hypothetical protein